ncbi:MAG: hypothetical protein IKK52_05475 [Alphaproteobacteria bacterium]|nr:hypothetical protein [Alphaproteobacteria bacterium]
MEVLKHQKIMWFIEGAIEELFCHKKTLPQDLVDDLVVRSDDGEWVWFFSCLERVYGRFKSSGSVPDFSLPLKLQEAVIARAQRGKWDEIKRYIAILPFDESLHFKFWKACRKNKKIISAYVANYPLVDDVLDRFWHNADDQAKRNYIIRHIISKEMAKKMWQEMANGRQVEFCQLYLKHHQLPEGVVEIILNDDLPYIPDLIDLIEYSAKPFSAKDEVLMLEKCGASEVGFYFKKFGILSPEAQKRLAELKDEEIFRIYTDHVGWFDSEVQTYILSPEFLQWNRGKELLAYFLMKSKKPMSKNFREKLNYLFVE